MPKLCDPLANRDSLCLGRQRMVAPPRGRLTTVEWREKCPKLLNWLPFLALPLASRHAAPAMKKSLSSSLLPSIRFRPSSDFWARIGANSALSLPNVSPAQHGVRGNRAFLGRPYFGADRPIGIPAGCHETAMSTGGTGLFPALPLTVRSLSCRKSSKPLLSSVSFRRWLGASCPTRSPKRSSLSSRFRPSPLAASSDLVMGRGETLAPHIPPSVWGAAC